MHYYFHVLSALIVFRYADEGTAAVTFLAEISFTKVVTEGSKQNNSCVFQVSFESLRKESSKCTNEK